MTVVKQKKCSVKACRKLFTPRSSTQQVCSWECAKAHTDILKAKVNKEHAKSTRATLKAAKLAIKPLSYWKQRAQTAINTYCRLRDLQAGHNCICCDKPFEPQKPGGSVDAGHWLSRGSHPNLRYDPRNISAQRKNCNRPGGTTAASFRLGMIKRWGIEIVEELEADISERHYKIPDLQEIEQRYLKLARELKNVQ